MFTHIRHAATRSRASASLKIDEVAHETACPGIAPAHVTGKRTLSACVQQVSERRIDPALLLTFMLAAAVCAMGILAIHALSIEGITR